VAGELVVKRSIEVVLELVQEHVGIRRRDDRLLSWYVAAENSAGRRRLLLHVKPAHELHLRLRAQEHAKGTDLVEIGVRRRCRLRRQSRKRAGAPARNGSPQSRSEEPAHNTRAVRVAGRSRRARRLWHGKHTGGNSRARPALGSSLQEHWASDSSVDPIGLSW